MPREVVGARLYTIDEVAEMLGVQEKAIMSCIDSGSLEAFRVGGLVYVVDAKLRAFINQGGEQEAAQP